MKLLTAKLGELEVREEDIYSFESGIPGFEQSRRFVLVTVKEHEPFAYLQSVDDSQLAFIMIDPFEFFSDYEFDLPVPELEELQIQSKEQIIIRSIVNVNDDLEHATTNLVAPVVMNAVAKRGKQVILLRADYSTKHRLFALETAK
ncbi:flagellar assembly protein FliW [Cohnella suwonensis]|uniref:Flagellar assembly factor FliW n=1 Tax=Cohnella suwonensis TaxID=696072 RepID=A0ABW0LY92_9BACL